MIGVILAAGVGSRLRPMTNNKPKCMVTTAGLPILQYQLNAYINAGIKDIIIVVGYEGSAIVEYCKHIKDINIKFVFNDIYEDSNNMYSFYLAKSFIYGKPFILNNADLSIDDTIVEKLIVDKRKDLIAVDVGLFNDESMKVSVNAEGKISDISKLVTEESSLGCSIDFYKFSAESSKIFIDKITQIVEVDKNLKDWTEVAMQELFIRQDLKFEAFDVSGLKWVEIDNYDDLAISDEIFSTAKCLTDYNDYFFDLDGVLYVGNEIIAGAVETISKLQKLGKKIYFISNNSSKSKIDYVKKLKTIGVYVEEKNIVLSTDGLIDFLNINDVKKVFVLGTKSLVKTVIDAGFDICSHKPEFVVVGYDTELTYEKLIDTSRLINSGVDFIATHCDLVCPSENGPIPDIGLLTSMLEKTTGKEVHKVFGKPSADFLKDFIVKNKVESENMIIIGDRLYTDIKLANNLGVDSILVLSGETVREQVELEPRAATVVLKDISRIFK